MMEVKKKKGAQLEIVPTSQQLEFATQQFDHAIRQDT